MSRFFISQNRYKDYTQADFFLSQCVSGIDEEEKEEIENDPEYLYMKGKIYKKEGNFEEAKLCFKKSSDCCNVDAMYEYAKIVFIEDPEKAFRLFEASSDDDDHEKSKRIPERLQYIEKS